MATNEKKSIIMPSASSSPKYNRESEKNKSWSERVEDYIKGEGNKNSVDVPPSDRFFLIKRTDGSFAQVSPFLIQKSLESFIGEPKSVKKLRSGDLLVEVKNSTQAQNIVKYKQFGTLPVTVSAHTSLNSSKGVISENDLLYVSESELQENLKNQFVTSVKRITIRRNEEIIPTKHIILTFNLPVLPQSIKAGYLECRIRPYIPNPLRCFKCQKFGHSKSSCRGILTCARCGEKEHENENCSAPPKCVNCQKDHPAYSKSCEKWKLEKEIQAVKAKQNISYPEAKKIVQSRTPNGGPSYSSVLSNTSTIKKQLKHMSTQTDNSPSASHLKSNSSQITNLPTKKEIKNSQSIIQLENINTKPKITENNKTENCSSISNPPNTKSSLVTLPPVKSSKAKPSIKINRRHNKAEMLINTSIKCNKKQKIISTKASTSKEKNHNKNSEELLLKLYPSDKEDDMTISSESEVDITI